MKRVSFIFILTALCFFLMLHINAEADTSGWYGFTLNWSDIPEAVSYNVQLYSASDNTSPIYSSKSPVSAFDFTSKILSDGGTGYYAKIYPVYSDGTSGEFRTSPSLSVDGKLRSTAVSFSFSRSGGLATSGTYFINGAKRDNTIYPDFTSSFLPGTRLNFNIVPSPDSRIFYWYNPVTGKILSFNNSCDISIGTSKKLMAHIVKISDGQNLPHHIAFVDLNSTNLKSNDINHGQSAVAPPSGKLGVFRGYTFYGWDKSFSSVTANMLISALYKKELTAYTVKIEYGAGDTVTLGRYLFDTEVNVSFDEQRLPQDKHFAGWSVGGSVISYDRSFSFYAGADTVLTPVYSDAPAVQKPCIALVKAECDDSCVSFLSFRTFPLGSENRYVESGIIATGSLQYSTQEKLVLDEIDGLTPIINGFSENGLANSEYMFNIKTTKNVYARAYLIYTDDSGNVTTIYSPIIYVENI